MSMRFHIKMMTSADGKTVFWWSMYSMNNKRICFASDNKRHPRNVINQVKLIAQGLGVNISKDWEHEHILITGDVKKWLKQKL